MITDRFAPASPERKARQFTLAPSFLAEFEGKQPKWGPVGYFTFKRCVDVSTPVLCDDLQWRPAGDLEVGQGIVGFDANVEGRGRFRHLRWGKVLHNKVEKAQTLGVELEDGTILYATPDHGWLVRLSETDNRLYWKETKDLAETHKGGAVHLLRPFGPVWEPDTSFEGGYLSAAYDGEGCLDRHNGIQFIQVQNEMLDQVRGFLTRKGVAFTQSKRKKVNGRQQVFVLRTSGRRGFYRVLGRFQPQRLITKFIERLKNKGGGALRTSPEDYVKVVRVFDAGERDIAVVSTSTETHFTGGFASHNTYARPTCDCNDPRTCGHPTEEFWQTCQRVVEGVYNVQKTHCRRLSLPWNEPKAQKSAQEMFQRMWDFKFTPPGRGLAQMGTPFMWQKGGACLNNPLHEDTPVLTRERGWVPIGTLAEQADVTLLSSIKLYGRDHTSTASKAIWTKASMSHVEIQPCKRIVLRDNSGFVTEIVASENHRWFRRGSTKQEWERVTTLDLNEGDQFPVVLPSKVAPVSHFGAQHGMFFGDGTRSNGELHQFGSSVAVLKHLFGSLAEKVDHRREDEWVVRNCPRAWAQIPTSLEDISYIYGFLAGYFAADGCVQENGSCSIASARRSELEDVRRLFQVVGVRVGDVRLSSTSSNLSDERELWTMTPHTHDLWEGFFLRDDHRERWGNRGQEPKRKYAKVVHIEDAGDQRVLCAVVPDYEQFVIDGFVLTSNCAFVSSEHIDEDFAGPFTFLMDMSMLGVGVGGDTRGAGKMKVQMPKLSDTPFVVSDDREGWVALAKVVINSFAGKGTFPTDIDFSKVRGKGKRIRGFGGTASGPGPLAKLVKNVARTLMPEGATVHFEETTSRAGKILRLQTVVTGEGEPYKITSGRITDIFNMVGACVVAGGVRRSAELMLGQATDIEFRGLKDPSDLIPLDKEMANLQANLEFAQGPERDALQAEIDALQEKIDLHPLRSHRWASNNSIFGEVGMDYAEVGQAIAKNGEPGIFWLDNARRFGRMMDPPNDKDRKAQGCNPCITGDTLIFTEAGPKRADKMIDQPFGAIVDGKVYECRTGVFQTGVKPVYLLQTKEGHSIRVTADHQILTASKVTAKKRYEVWVEAQDLTPGDKVVLNNVRDVVRSNPSTNPAAIPMEWGEHEGKFDLGWLFGNLLGDGHFKRDQETAKLQFWGSTKQVMLDLALKRIETLSGDPRYHQMRTGNEVEDRDMVSTGSRRLWELAPEFGISHDKDIIGDRILLDSSSFQAGFLRGLFDADGSVQGIQAKGVSVRLTSVNRQHLMVAQKMLMHFGINSSIYWNRHSEGPQEFPTGTYECQARHELVIANDNIQVFSDRIGFDDPEKQEKLAELLDNYKRGLNRDRFVAEVESVTYVGIEPVYDCTVDEVHRFGANGITVHNCAEQTLESFELCCVSSDTRITTRTGAPRISEVVGQEVDVWNGERWSTVTPFVAAQGKKLYRVHLSDGSYLDCTDDHKWEVLPPGKREYRQVETKDLVMGSKSVAFALTLPCVGDKVEFAYEWGFFTGDGYVDHNHQQVMAKLHGPDRMLENVLRGKVYKEQHPEGYSDPFNRINFTGFFREAHPEDFMFRAVALNDKTSGLPDWAFSMDRESTLRFVAGWIEADGNVCKQVNTDNYRVFGTEAKMRDLQMLLRRVGVNHASTYLMAEAGETLVINKRETTRNHDLWVCLIPSFECEEISRYCHLKVARRFGSRYAANNAHSEGAPIDRARKQKIVDVEELPGEHTTYCFTEPERHMGVFGNVLTYQCLVETYPAHHESYADFERTLKFAYLYAKTVTLMGTHDPRTNAVMIRNRRIGASMSGIRQAIEKFGRREFLRWCDTGYHYIQDLDTTYSDWLGIPRSIKTTSVKPSGCRPWYALTSTNQGLLTLEDLFEHHPADQEWAEQPDHDLEALGTGIITKTYNNGVAPVLRITTSYGIEVESTPNHQWWVTQRYDRKKSQKYQDVNEWWRADEIQPGDILDIQPGIYNMEGGVELAPLNSLALNMRGDATEIQQPKRMNPRLAWLLGYLWGDGAMSPSKYRLRWVDARRENLEKAQAILKEQFGLDASIQQASEHRKAETLEVGSKHLWHWLIRNDVFKLYAGKIDIIPKVVRASGQEEILAFLAGLLDADGWAGLTEQGAKLVWTMADEFFARHVQDVALAVGLVLGRSHITGGSSFQNCRSMYHLTQSAHVGERAFNLFRRHSTKVADIEARSDFPGWHCLNGDEMTSGKLILGKVLKVEPVGEMPTFDVEVHGDFHWYYAGAIKSHNTVSLLCGATPGIHPPHSPFYIRNIRVADVSPLRQAAIDAGYKVEKDAYADGTSVISFPVKTDNCSVGKRDVSIWEQVALAADIQRYWADNQVSVTVTFTAEEAKEIPTVLEVFEDRLKSISFLPLSDDHGYVQAPYIAITEDEFNAMSARIKPMNLDANVRDQQDQFCDGEACLIDFGSTN